MTLHNKINWELSIRAMGCIQSVLRNLRMDRVSWSVIALGLKSHLHTTKTIKCCEYGPGAVFIAYCVLRNLWMSPISKSFFPWQTLSSCNNWQVKLATLNRLMLWNFHMKFVYLFSGAPYDKWDGSVWNILCFFVCALNWRRNKMWNYFFFVKTHLSW